MEDAGGARDATRAAVSVYDPSAPVRYPAAQLSPRPWRRLRTFAAVCVGLCPLMPAQAGLTTTALARFTTNYLYHGYTKSDDHPAVQAHAGVTHGSGVYGGLWLTQVDFGGAQLEAIPYLGAQTTLAGDWRFDAVLSGYVYEAEVFGRNADYFETSASVDWRGLLSARLSVAADSYGSGHVTAAGEVKGRYPLSDVVDFTCGAGFDNLAAVTTYDVVYWNVGLSYFLGAHVVVDLRYADNAYINEVHSGDAEEHFARAEVGGRALLSISVGF